MTYDIAKVTAALTEAGYSADQIKQGLAYADTQDAEMDNDAYCSAISRILYSDEQMADGAVFAGDISIYDAA